MDVDMSSTFVLVLRGLVRTVNPGAIPVQGRLQGLAFGAPSS
jgi:hypothetical protein